MHRAVPRLAGGHPRLGKLDAVVDAVPDQVHQGIVELFDDRLVQLGLGPFRRHLDLLAKLRREIAHQPLELAEGTAYRQHPDVEGAVPEFGGEPLHLLRNRQQFHVRPLGGGLGQACLHGDHLAHQVDQEIEPFGGDPDARGGLRPLLLLAHLLYVPLLDQGRLHLTLMQYPLRDGQLAELPLLGEEVLHLLGSDVPALQEDLPEFLVILLLLEPAVLGHHADLQLAVVLYEDEDVADRVLPLVGGQDDVPVDVACLRVDLFEPGEVAGLRHNAAGAKILQLAQQGERVAPGGEDLARRDEAYAVGDRVPGSGFCALLPGGGGCGGLEAGQLPEPHDDSGARLEVHPVPVIGAVQHRLDLVPGSQGQVHQSARDLQLPVAHHVEDGLHLVGEARDVVEAEHRA